MSVGKGFGHRTVRSFACSLRPRSLQGGTAMCRPGEGELGRERERWVSTGWCVNCGFGQTSQAACHPDHASDIPCRHNTLRASGWLPIKITDRHSIEVCPVACPQRTSSSARTWEERSLRFRGQPSDYNPHNKAVFPSRPLAPHITGRESTGNRMVWLLWGWF